MPAHWVCTLRIWSECRSQRWRSYRSRASRLRSSRVEIRCSIGRYRYRYCFRRIWKHHRGGPRQKRALRFWSMNFDEIERFLRARVRDFDGVFSIDNLPDDPHLLVFNKDLTGLLSTSRMDAENFLIRLDIDLTLTLNVIWIVIACRETLMIDSYRV